MLCRPCLPNIHRVVLQTTPVPPSFTHTHTRTHTGSCVSCRAHACANSSQSPQRQLYDHYCSRLVDVSSIHERQTRPCPCVVQLFCAHIGGWALQGRQPRISRHHDCRLKAGEWSHVVHLFYCIAQQWEAA